jgi:ribosomal protein S15P/S13E
MEKVVNLRRFSKQKQRERRAEEATANAAKHGQTKAERAAASKRIEALNSHLDGHKKDVP